MFGSGFIEMLARQMTSDRQAIRDGIAPGGESALVTKGVSFGTLRRGADGSMGGPQRGEEHEAGGRGGQLLEADAHGWGAAELGDNGVDVRTPADKSAVYRQR